MFLNLDGDKVVAIVYPEKNATPDMVEYNGEEPEFTKDRELFSGVLKYNETDGLHYEYTERPSE